MFFFLSLSFSLTHVHTYDEHTRAHLLSSLICYRKPKQIDPEILRSVKVMHNLCCVPNPRKGHRNQAPYNLGKENGTKRQLSVPESPIGRGTSLSHKHQWLLFCLHLTPESCSSLIRQSFYIFQNNFQWVRFRFVVNLFLCVCTRIETNVTWAKGIMWINICQFHTILNTCQPWTLIPDIEVCEVPST